MQIETAEALENVRRGYPRPPPNLPTTTSYLPPSVPLPIPKTIPSPPTSQTAHAQVNPTSKAEAITRIPGVDVLLIGPL